MDIECKLSINNMLKNWKRTTYTTISIILCSILIFITMTLTVSIKNGVEQSVETQYNDYHIVLKNQTKSDFEKIKYKDYISKMYIQSQNDDKIIEINKPFDLPNNFDIFNIYIKYINDRDVCDFTTDIAKILKSPDENLTSFREKIEFNQALLTIHGLIDLDITEKNYSPVCIARVNYSYVINIMTVVLIFVFSILFIIILYNSFLITINEREKEYAVLNSVGALQNQILKIFFIETLIMGFLGIILGGILSFFFSKIILNIFNKIINGTGYKFNLVFNIKYAIISVLIICINLYFSALIPSLKASTTTVIQGIRNNKEIKYKKTNSLIDKILPVEGRIAVKNIKRNRNKYYLITCLLVVCMISYISVTTYINYEKQSAELITEYDVDADLSFEEHSSNSFYKIIKTYENQYDDIVQVVANYKMLGAFALVDNNEAMATENFIHDFADGKKGINVSIIGLDNEKYNEYLKFTKSNYGDIIVFNNTTNITGETSLKYSYEKAFNENVNFKLSIIAINESNNEEQNDDEDEKFEELTNDDGNIYELNNNEDEDVDGNGETNYEIIDSTSLDGKMIFTDKLIDGFKEFKSKYHSPCIFVNLDTFNKIESNFISFVPAQSNSVKQWIYEGQNVEHYKIKCNNVLGFSNYIDDVSQKKSELIDSNFYSLKNREKIIYINIVNLILKVLLIMVISVGIISTMNIINASLVERKQDFYILNSIGATKKNIKSILIYECLYMYFKALCVSIILCIPIIWSIIKYMKNIINLNKLAIPFGSILVYLLILLFISLMVTFCSIHTIEDTDSLQD